MVIEGTLQQHSCIDMGHNTGCFYAKRLLLWCMTAKTFFPQYSQVTFVFGKLLQPIDTAEIVILS